MRLLNAGKTLFARNGYEQTSTATIARESGSSESQLIRYFGGKAGLLEAIFNESWTRLNEMIQGHLSESAHGRDGIIRLLTQMSQAFAQDHDIAFLFLFEGRRIRGGTPAVVLSKGYHEFLKVLESLIEGGQADGSFRKDISPQVMASAMLGCAEGMIRDRLIAERSNEAHTYDDGAVLRTFTAMVNGLAG